jgi:hypothetical protein
LKDHQNVISQFFKEGSNNQADEEHQDSGTNNSGYLTQLKRARRSLSGETKQSSVLLFIRNEKLLFLTFTSLNLASAHCPYFSVFLTKCFQLEIVCLT